MTGSIFLLFLILINTVLFSACTTNEMDTTTIMPDNSIANRVRAAVAQLFPAGKLENLQVKTLLVRGAKPR